MTSDRPRLLLFDIDLTLVRTGGAGLRAMETAFRRYVSFEGPLSVPQPDGQTDPHIVQRLFTQNGQAYDAARDYEPFLQSYLAELEVEARCLDGWTLLPGVTELLRVLRDHEGFRLGLITGNDERGARLKLAPFGLNPFFPVGGFASDSAIRHELIPMAITRAEAHYALPFSRSEVITIGDSIYDVLAANEEGIHCLAVCSGRTSREDLAQAGARVILPDLADTAAVLAALKAF